MKKWSREYDCCIKCNTTTVKHKALGMCGTCYEKKRDNYTEIKKIALRKYRKENIEKVRESQRNSKKKKKEELHSLLGNKCVKCGFSDSRALQIDHINGGGYTERKEYNRNPAKYYSNILNSILNNENKYQLLCANCNWIKRTENNEIRKI